MAENQVDKRVAMTPQQKRFSSSSKSVLEVYRELVVGDKGWFYLLGYELYHMVLAGLGGMAGYGLRRVLLPPLLSEGGKGVSVGKGVIIRQPNRVHLGKNVLIDDYAALDVRTDESSAADAGIYIDDHALIGRQSIIIAKGGKVSLGKACNVSSYCRIGSQSKVVIGDSVLIAAYAYIGAGNHKLDDLNQPIMEQGMDILSGVSIGKNVWVGARVTILDGVTIGDDAVIGAHSLVLENVPPRAIVVGTPAKIIKYRT